MKSATLLREVVREYVRAQRRVADCGDTASTVECHLLTELRRADGVTQQELANRLMLDKGWISRGVDRLVEAGLVARTPDERDRRRVQLRLLPAGQERAAALDDRLDSHATSLLDRLSPDQDQQLAGILTQVLANLGRPGCLPNSACSTPEVRLRRADRTDWPGIEALLRDAGLPAEDARDHLDRFTVSVAGTELVAVGGFELHGEHALLRSFVVAPGSRGRGQGGALLELVLRAAAQAGATRVYLLTEGAAPFFARHGFRTIERLEAPDAIRRTRQFESLCPASARLMTRTVTHPESSPC